MKYVAYYRVSTAKQGIRGLGMDAQEKAVSTYLDAQDGELIDSYREVESGKNDRRPEMEKALRRCRLTGATLVIAKLDRLSRNAAFLMTLRDSEIAFVCCDLPEANSLTIGIIACMAEYERQMISERTKAGLAAKKARGETWVDLDQLARVRTGDTTAATAARVEASVRRKAEIAEVIGEMEQDAGESLSSRVVATRLNEAGYTTSRGNQWSHVAVLRVMCHT